MLFYLFISVVFFITPNYYKNVITMLLKKRVCVVPTVWGWLLIVVIFASLSLPALLSLNGFLSPTKPQQHGTLIIEGWIPDYCFVYIAKLFLTEKRYNNIIVVGGPLEEGSYLIAFKNYASVGSATLRALSIPDSSIITVPAPLTPKDRTFSAAAALKKFIDSTHYSVNTFDLCSHATHTRRSALLYRKALGNEYHIGSIAIPNREYNPRYWWKTSSGVRSVIDESIAYLYALLFVTFS